MKDTKNRHYIKRPKYAPTRINKDGKEYHFTMAYIDNIGGLEMVYQTKERARIVRGPFGETWKEKESLYLHYSMLESLMKKYGFEAIDILKTEAENGFTRHIESIAIHLEYEWPQDEEEDAAIKEAQEEMARLLAIARKAKQ